MDAMWISKGPPTRLRSFDPAVATMADPATVDLTDEAAVSKWADSIGRQHGSADNYYADAAATRFSPIESLEFSDWK